MRVLYGLLTLVMTTGCFFKPGPPAGTSGDDAPGDDAGIDAPDPTMFGPWKIAFEVQLGGPGGASIDGYPSISTSGHELFFVSSRSGRERLYVATRADASVPFAGADVTAISGVDEESEPTISSSGLDLYFVQSQLQLRYHRDTIGGTWQTASNDLPALGPFDFGGPDRIVGGTSRNPFDVGSDIVEFTKPGAQWSQGMSFGVAGESDTAPTMRRDGLEVLYEYLGGGTYETRRAVRATTTSAFSVDATPPAVPGFPKIGDPELSADGTELYFTADQKIFVTRRDPL